MSTQLSDRSSSIDYVSMVDNEDWMLRPVLRGLCRYESLRDTTLTLEDFMLMNEAIDIEIENQERFRKAHRG